MTIKKIDWQMLCHEAGLEAPESFWKADPEEIRKVFNGAGPDDLPTALRTWLKSLGITDTSNIAASMRAILTQLLSLYKLAYVIHDWMFALADKTRAGFKLANDIMWRNMIRLLDAVYSVWNLLRWDERIKWWAKARTAYVACCSDAGWSAWLSDGEVVKQ